MQGRKKKSYYLGNLSKILPLTCLNKKPVVPALVYLASTVSYRLPTSLLHKGVFNNLCNAEVLLPTVSYLMTILAQMIPP